MKHLGPIRLTFLAFAFVLARPVAQATTSIRVRVLPDRSLHLSSGAPCPAGQASYNLALDGALPHAPDEDKTASAQINELKKTVDFLKTRVSNLEHELANEANAKDHLSQKVIAPFEVVDKSGRMIFRVRDDRHGFEMANTAGQTVLWGSALDGGGVFKTRNASGFPEAVMGSVGGLGAFVLRDGEDADRASMTLSGGKTSLDLRNDNHVNIASLHQAPTGGGFLQLGAPGGESAVQAGVTTGGKCGKVEALPRTNPGRQMVGAPASFIVGGC